MNKKKQELSGFWKGLESLNSTEQLLPFFDIYGRLPETSKDFAVVRHNDLRQILCQHLDFLRHPQKYTGDPFDKIHYHLN